MVRTTAGGHDALSLETTKLPSIPGSTWKRWPKTGLWVVQDVVSAIDDLRQLYKVTRVFGNL